MASQISQFLGQLSSGLNTPSPGDTLEIAFTDLEGILIGEIIDHVVAH